MFAKYLMTAAVAVALMLPEESRAQDPVEVSPSVYSVVFENADIRVMVVTYAPGQGDNWHSHPGYMVYVLQGGQVRVYDDAGGSVDREVVLGPARRAESVGRHRLDNIGETTVQLLSIEFKN